MTKDMIGDGDMKDVTSEELQYSSSDNNCVQ